MITFILGNYYILGYFNTLIVNPRYVCMYFIIVTICFSSPFQFVIMEVIPQMGDASSATNRQGAVETISCIQ